MGTKIKRDDGTEYYKIKSDKNYLDGMTIEMPNKKKIVELVYDSAEYTGSFSLKQIKEIRDCLSEILKEAKYE